MIDIEAVMADFAVRQAERQVQVTEEIQQLNDLLTAETDPVARAELHAQIQEGIAFCDSLGYVVEVKKVNVINVASGKRPD